MVARCCPRCAQRLSASQRFSPSPGRSISYCDPLQKCSTPFGITEVLTSVGQPRRQRYGRLVLNAFRHHRGSHRNLGEVGRSPIKTWVLNAFRHHRGSHTWGACDPGAEAGNDVLNAFRHHRGSHTEECERSRRKPSNDVLNAFRHHRGSHRGRLLSLLLLLLDSVLNAFRHHRGSHPAQNPASPRARRILCSTPFGITEVLTSITRPKRVI